MEQTFFSPKKVLFGEYSISKLKQLMKEEQIEKPFVLFSRSALENSFLKEHLSDDAQVLYEMPKGEPTMTHLREAKHFFTASGCDGVVAIGGGSVLDLGKAIATVKDESQQFELLASYEKIERYPMIAVPTTAGTGSEATKISVLIDEEKHVKYNPGHPDLIYDAVILDHTMTTTVPKKVTAHTGLDALTHAIEAYVSTKANEMTDFYALEAIRRIHHSLKAAYEDGLNLEARKNMLIGSFYAGLAFSNASTNLAHATGRALGARWNIPHGLSVALTHPFVVEFTRASAGERYDNIAQILKMDVANYLHEANDHFSIWKQAKDYIDEQYLASIEEMTDNALSGNGILTNRQVPEKSDVKQIFESIYEKIQATI